MFCAFIKKKGVPNILVSCDSLSTYLTSFLSDVRVFIVVEYVVNVMQPFIIYL